MADAPLTSEPAHAPLSVGEKIGYGLGDTASNLYWKLFESFQLIFYTDVFGISAASAATMFFVTKIWDAINDPIVGLIADRTRTTWGRFRPYLLWMAVPFAVTGILTFYTRDLSPCGNLVYAYVTYTLVDFFGRRFGESTTALVNGVEVLVVDRQTGFFWTVVCYSVVAVLLFLCTFWTTRERVQPIEAENHRLSSDVSDLLRNRPWLVLLAVGLFQILSDWTRGSAIAYYFTYFVKIGRISVSTSGRRRTAGAERRDHPGYHRDDELRPRPLSARGDRRPVLLQRHERDDPADRSRPGCAQVPRERAAGCLRWHASSADAHAPPTHLTEHGGLS